MRLTWIIDLLICVLIGCIEAEWLRPISLVQIVFVKVEGHARLMSDLQCLRIRFWVIDIYIGWQEGQKHTVVVVTEKSSVFLHRDLLIENGLIAWEVWKALMLGPPVKLQSIDRRFRDPRPLVSPPFASYVRARSPQYQCRPWSRSVFLMSFLARVVACLFTICKFRKLCSYKRDAMLAFPIFHLSLWDNMILIIAHQSDRHQSSNSECKGVQVSKWVDFDCLHLPLISHELCWHSSFLENMNLMSALVSPLPFTGFQIISASPILEKERLPRVTHRSLFLELDKDFPKPVFVKAALRHLPAHRRLAWLAKPTGRQSPLASHWLARQTLLGQNDPKS